MPDSNRMPLAVLQACFRKHLPTILRAGLVFPGTPQIPASFALAPQGGIEPHYVTGSLPYLSRSRAHAIGPRHIYACRLSGCQASLPSALPPRSHPAGVPVSPGCQAAASVFALTPMTSGCPASVFPSGFAVSQGLAPCGPTSGHGYAPCGRWRYSLCKASLFFKSIQVKNSRAHPR